MKLTRRALFGLIPGAVVAKKMPLPKVAAPVFPPLRLWPAPGAFLPPFYEEALKYSLACEMMPLYPVPKIGDTIQVKAPQRWLDYEQARTEALQAIGG